MVPSTQCSDKAEDQILLEIIDVTHSFSHRNTSVHASISGQAKHRTGNLESPSSRPMSPAEQLDIMHRQEEGATQTEPSDIDLEVRNCKITL